MKKLIVVLLLLGVVCLVFAPEPREYDDMAEHPHTSGEAGAFVLFPWGG